MHLHNPPPGGSTSRFYRDEGRVSRLARIFCGKWIVAKQGFAQPEVRIVQIRIEHFAIQPACRVSGPDHTA